MTAAKTVSRANDAVSGPPETIRVTIKATSMTVTATASTSEPNGSPIRCATTSAWCTAVDTAPASANATMITKMTGRSTPHVNARTTSANSGTLSGQDRIRALMPYTFAYRTAEITSARLSLVDSRMPITLPGRDVGGPDGQQK